MKKYFTIENFSLLKAKNDAFFRKIMSGSPDKIKILHLLIHHKSLF